MNRKFWIHLLLNARLQRGIFCAVFNETSFQPYRCKMQTEIPMKIDGPHFRQLGGATIVVVSKLRVNP